ncbi:MAG: hypothetical protein AMXMBFR20_36460 [Planctomycetia bacterium]
MGAGEEDETAIWQLGKEHQDRRNLTKIKSSTYDPFPRPTSWIHGNLGKVTAFQYLFAPTAEQQRSSLEPSPIQEEGKSAARSIIDSWRDVYIEMPN